MNFIEACKLLDEFGGHIKRPHFTRTDLIPPRPLWMSDSMCFEEEETGHWARDEWLGLEDIFATDWQYFPSNITHKP